MSKDIAGNSEALQEYVKNTDAAALSQESFAKSQQTVVTGTTKFGAAMKSAGGVIKSVGTAMLNMGVAMVASFAIGAIIKGIDYLWNYSDNIIKNGKEAKDAIDNTFKSFEDGNTSIKDMASGLSDSTEQIKTTSI